MIAETTIAGAITLAVTKGNVEAASNNAAIESLGTAAMARNLSDVIIEAASILGFDMLNEKANQQNGQQQQNQQSSQQQQDETPEQQEQSPSNDEQQKPK